MAHAIWDTSGDANRRWNKRKAPSMGIPAWAGLLIVVLGLALAGTLLWQGGKYAWQRLNGSSGVSPGGSANASPSNPAPGNAPGIVRARVPEWQVEAQEAFRDGVTDATTGNIDGAEMDLDRGAELLTEARARQMTPSPDFFDVAIRTIDQVAHAQPDNDRLVEHATLARIELAQMRTMLPAATPASGDGVAAAVVAGGASSSRDAAEDSPAKPGEKGAEFKTLQILAPLSIAANTTYDAAKAGGDVLDATMMAEDAEVLLPPASRLFTDGVRVRNITVKGASQTLDGVFWENVTFIGTRLRYDGGEVDLRNVRFIDCTFGMEPNDRGARLATAIALGQTTIVIE